MLESAILTLAFPLNPQTPVSSSVMSKIKTKTETARLMSVTEDKFLIGRGKKSLQNTFTCIGSTIVMNERLAQSRNERN